MKKLKEYRNRFVWISELEDGTWDVYNHVVGFSVAHCPNYASARSRMVELTQRYLSIEKGVRFTRPSL